MGQDTYPGRTQPCLGDPGHRNREWHVYHRLGSACMAPGRTFTRAYAVDESVAIIGEAAIPNVCP